MKRLLTEIAILVAVGIAMTPLFLGVVYPAMGLPTTGPVPVRTVVLALVATWLIRTSGRAWSDYGLSVRIRWWQLVLAVLVVLIAKAVVVQPAADWLRASLSLAESDLSFFAHIEGSVPALIIWLVIAWVAGGFAEEMVFRGYLMKRIAEVLGGGRGAWVVGLLLQAVIFGAGHAYVGAGGAISGTLSAILFGAVVLVARGSLWPAIIAHGLWDSLGMVILYSGNAG